MPTYKSGTGVRAEAVDQGFPRDLCDYKEVARCTVTRWMDRHERRGRAITPDERKAYIAAVETIQYEANDMAFVRALEREMIEQDRILGVVSD